MAPVKWIVNHAALLLAAVWLMLGSAMLTTPAHGADSHKAEGGAAAEADEHGHSHDGPIDPHHVGAPHGPASPAEFRTDLAIYSFIVFLILLGVLAKFAWGPILAALAKREHVIEEHLAAAERKHEDAKALLVEYERKLAGAQDQVRALLDEARRDAARNMEEALAKAREEAKFEIDRAKREIQGATDGALKNLTEHLTSEAISLAGKIVSRELKPADHAAMIRDAVERFPGMANRN